MTETSPRIVLGVAAVIWNGRGEVLLIRRAKEPRIGQWSLPGGKVEFGETLIAAVLREVSEETGLEVEILGLIDVAETIRDAAAGAGSDRDLSIQLHLQLLSGALWLGLKVSSDVGSQLLLPKPGCHGVG